MVAEVIPLEPRRRGRPSAAADAEEARMELDSRTLEERRMARDLAPIIRRLEFGIIELGGGPRWMAEVHRLDYELRRHARRWSPAEPGEAA